MGAVSLAYARLTRPANLPTAAADILAGVAIAGIIPDAFEAIPISTANAINLLYLVLASVLLYAGGVTLNDVFDYELDKVERPERPIPMGIISRKSAAVFGGLLLVAGVVMAFFSSTVSGTIAGFLAISILLYDAFSKKYDFFGPLNMGICRGLNLVMGISILGEIDNWWYALIPLVYIFAITMISRGEVHGSNKKNIILAALLYFCVILSFLAIVLFSSANNYVLILYLLFFSIVIFKPLGKAYMINSPENIKKAVMAGVLSLIILDATLAVAFSSWWYGLLVILLLPLSLGLSRIFAVT
ncbi:MAG: UbiA-like protein EboC [Eudoraea sp.]|nr:UbiA-like protein EboC [Eudoraea sp.]